MPKKKKIFLESHNIVNPYMGFGQFNYWLIKSLTEFNKDFELTAYAKDKSFLEDFDQVKFRKYYSFHRHQPLRIRKRYHLWHSLNQNSKIEPYHSLPYLLTIHDVIFMEEDENSQIAIKKRKLLKNKITRANAIVFISNYARESTNKFFDIPGNIPQYVIYNGNPVNKQKSVISIPSAVGANKPFLFSIGQFVKKKNFHTLVGMLAKLKEYNLVIAGNNNKPYTDLVKEAIAKYNLQDRVFLVGQISENEKNFYLQNCEALVFPSLHEGFGLPPIEAMAHGKPVFLANRTSLPEIGGKVAFYWDHFDPEYMAAIVTKGLKEVKENNHFSEKVQAHAAKFTWANAASKYLEVYKSITDSQGE